MKKIVDIYGQVLSVLMDKIMGTLVVAVGMCMCVVIWLQIFARNFMSMPPTWTEEICRLTFIWFGSLAAVYALWKKQHMVVDLLYSKLGASSRKIFDYFIQICVIILGFVLLKEGLGLLKIFSIQKTAILRWPMATFYAPVPISGAGYLMIGIYSLLKISITNYADNPQSTQLKD